MAHPLLPFDERPQLKTEYFPTRFQCFIYRNHEMITAALAARVLATDEATVIAHAEAMGLTGFATPEVERMWLTRGYITLIRANWHLLTNYVGREKVGGKLYATEIGIYQFGQCLDGKSLCQAGKTLEQNVTVGQQANE